jgi:hypothetical protein
MPDERFIHPAEGESEKLTELSDFEFRVWIAYKVSANDVGVMLDSPFPMQTGNRNLRNRPAKDVRKALDRLLTLGLVHGFAAGGERYVYARNWQDWQTVKYPRTSHLPLPPEDEIVLCTEATQALFSDTVAGRGGASNVNEREVEQRLIEMFQSTWPAGSTVQRQVRLGNSYCDIVVIPPTGAILAVEVKKHPLSPAALTQVERYAEALRQQWPNREVAPVLVGRGLGRLTDADLCASRVAAILFDRLMNMTVIDRSTCLCLSVMRSANAWSLTANNSELTPVRGTARNANANANATANALNGEEPEKGPALNLAPGQLRLAARQLGAEWNSRVKPPVAEVNVEPSIGRAISALRLRPDLRDWCALIDRAMASDFLTGKVPGPDGKVFKLDFWWFLEHAHIVESGRYDNREKAKDTAAQNAERKQLAVQRHSDNVLAVAKGRA